jgi:hypothetical protein
MSSKVLTLNRLKRRGKLVKAAANVARRIANDASQDFADHVSILGESSN